MINARELFEKNEKYIIVPHSKDEYYSALEALANAGYEWTDKRGIFEVDCYGVCGCFIIVHSDHNLQYLKIERIFSGCYADFSSYAMANASEIYYEREKFQEGDDVRIKSHDYTPLIGATGRVIGYDAKKSTYYIICKINDDITTFAYAKENDIEKM